MPPEYDTSVQISGREVSTTSPTYFVADIASNHDGELSRAEELIAQCADAGADAAKFQHFLAKDIVSDYGFRQLGGQVAHQAAWKKPVYDVYEQYELRREWTAKLAATAAEAGVDFLTTPYDVAAVELVSALVPAFKIGSGDITWTDFISEIAAVRKPVLLATGASEMVDVERAVAAVLERNRQLVLLQCNTNYTGNLENLHYVNLRVLQAYARKWPGLPLGLSDHTPGHATVLGAIALGARVVEKHFTDDNAREGPDHGFSMNPRNWREMIDRSRELEAALGDGVKRIETNENDSVVVQRRCLRLTRNRRSGDVLTEEDLASLRPAPDGSLDPHEATKVLGRALTCDKTVGEAVYQKDVSG